MRGGHFSKRLRRMLSPSDGSRRNAAQALDEIAAQGDQLVLHDTDLALPGLSSQPAESAVKLRQGLGRHGCLCRIGEHNDRLFLYQGTTPLVVALNRVV